MPAGQVALVLACRCCGEWQSQGTKCPVNLAGLDGKLHILRGDRTNDWSFAAFGATSNMPRILSSWLMNDINESQGSASWSSFVCHIWASCNNLTFKPVVWFPASKSCFQRSRVTVWNHAQNGADPGQHQGLCLWFWHLWHCIGQRHCPKWLHSHNPVQTSRSCKHHQYWTQKSYPPVRVQASPAAVCNHISRGGLEGSELHCSQCASSGLRRFLEATERSDPCRCAFHFKFQRHPLRNLGDHGGVGSPRLATSTSHGVPQRTYLRQGVDGRNSKCCSGCSRRSRHSWELFQPLPLHCVQDLHNYGCHRSGGRWSFEECLCPRSRNSGRNGLRLQHSSFPGDSRLCGDEHVGTCHGSSTPHYGRPGWHWRSDAHLPWWSLQKQGCRCSDWPRWVPLLSSALAATIPGRGGRRWAYIYIYYYIILYYIIYIYIYIILYYNYIILYILVYMGDDMGWCGTMWEDRNNSW